MADPVMLFSLLIAVSWAWSLFTPPADAMHQVHRRGAAPPALARTHKRHLPQIRWNRDA
jgi:hypothetical protein